MGTALQDPVVNTSPIDGKPATREKVSWKVLPFPLKQVRLGEGPCKVAMEADRQFLHSLPPDRLLHPSVSTPESHPPPRHLVGGKSPIANSAAITLAATIFPPPL
jgi:hypothetical protein